MKHNTIVRELQRFSDYELRTHTLHSALTGELQVVFSEFFGKNISRDMENALYPGTMFAKRYRGISRMHCIRALCLSNDIARYRACTVAGQYVLSNDLLGSTGTISQRLPRSISARQFHKPFIIFKSCVWAV